MILTNLGMSARMNSGHVAVDTGMLLHGYRLVRVVLQYNNQKHKVEKNISVNEEKDHSSKERCLQMEISFIHSVE